MLTGLLGALASTLDTHLNWGSSYWSNDIYGDLVCRKWLKREGRSSELVWVARLSNLLILVIALTIMFNLGSIQQAWFISLLFGAGMGAVLVLRWLWEKINLFSEIAAIATSLIVAPFILIYVEEEWARLASMAGASLIVVIVVTLLTRETDHDKLDSFYRQIKPQGFWSKTAARIGDISNAPLIKLRKSMWQVMITGISLYCLLIGLGKLMFRPSSESIWFTLLLIVAGAALIPVWINSLKKHNP